MSDDGSARADASKPTASPAPDKRSVGWLWRAVVIAAVCSAIAGGLASNGFLDLWAGQRDQHRTIFYGVLGFDDLLSFEVAGGNVPLVRELRGWIAMIVGGVYFFIFVFSLATCLFAVGKTRAGGDAAEISRGASAVPSRPDRLMQLLCLAFPCGMIFLALFVLVTVVTGVWNQWVFVNPGVIYIHRGNHFIPPRYSTGMATPLLAYALAFVALRALTRRLPHARIIPSTTLGLPLLGSATLAVGLIVGIYFAVGNARDDWWLKECAIGTFIFGFFSAAAWIGLYWLVRSVQFSEALGRKARPPHLCPQCEYDLRGTLASGRTECPECGAKVQPVAAADLPRLDGTS